MPGSKTTGPLCQVLGRPVRLEDGTLCRCESPLPGPVGTEPWMVDNFRWPVGVDNGKPLGEEGWFEHRYPNLLEDARLKFVGIINSWVQSNWGQTQFQDQKQRVTVYARDVSYRNADNSISTVKKSDNRFERCGKIFADGFEAFGDLPQNAIEADQVLGAFSIDIETPFTISYSRKNIRGQMVDTFEWTAVMYVEDVLGLQKSNNAAQLPIIGEPLLWSAPSRRVKRAKWKIRGEGVSNAAETYHPEPVRLHKVIPGDTLSKLAEKYYDDPRLWLILYETNRISIGNNQNILPIGLQIIIPDLSKLSQSVIDRAKATPPLGGPNIITMPPLL